MRLVGTVRPTRKAPARFTFQSFDQDGEVLSTLRPDSITNLREAAQYADGIIEGAQAMGHKIDKVDIYDSEEDD